MAWERYGLGRGVFHAGAWNDELIRNEKLYWTVSLTWFVFAILTAVAVASQDAWIKKWFSHLNPVEMFVLPLLFGLPLTLVTLLFVPVPALDRVFYISFAVSLPLNAVPFILYMAAIRQSPLSLTLPYLAFTPVFMVPTGYFLLDELPDAWGLVGILTVCAGSYVLNIDVRHWSVFEPLKAVFRERGSWIMLIVALIFAFSSVVGKLAIMHSSVMFFQMSFFAVLGITLALGFGIAGKIRFAKMVEHPVKGIVAGILVYFHILFHGIAIAMTKAAYMISIKRMSILLGVVYGGYFFDEDNIVIRFLGSLLMVAGAVIILVAGE